MHRCLEVQELFREIVEYVLEEPSTAQHGVDRRSVANVALACRAFYGGATDVLWSKLDDLFPLIKCMSKDLWEEEVVREEFGGPRHTLVRSASGSLLLGPDRPPSVLRASRRRVTGTTL